MPENAIYVGRPSKFGNPFIVGRDGNRETCYQLYGKIAQGYLCLTSQCSTDEQKKASKAMLAAKTELKGKDLACWCPLTVPCHADVLLAIANDDAPCGE